MEMRVTHSLHLDILDHLVLTAAVSQLCHSPDYFPPLRSVTLGCKIALYIFIVPNPVADGTYCRACRWFILDTAFKLGADRSWFTFLSLIVYTPFRRCTGRVKPLAMCLR